MRRSRWTACRLKPLIDVDLAVPLHPLQARKLFVKGHMPSLDGLHGYRVLLAPLRFGAGLKVTSPEQG